MKKIVICLTCLALFLPVSSFAKCKKMTSLVGGNTNANEYLWTDNGAFYECGDNCDNGTIMTGKFRLEGKEQQGTFMCVVELSGDYWKKINNGDNCVLWTSLWGGNSTSNEYLWKPDGSGFYECGDGCPNGTKKTGRFKLKEETKTGTFTCHEEWNGDYWSYEDTSSGNNTEKTCDGKAHGTVENVIPCTFQSLIDKHAATCKKKCDNGTWKHAIVTCKPGYTPSEPSVTVPGAYKNCVSSGNGGGGNGGGGNHGGGNGGDNGGGATFICPQDKLQLVATLKIKCANNTDVVAQLTALESQCNTGIAQAVFESMLAELTEIAKTACGESEEQKACKQIPDASWKNGKCECNDSDKEVKDGKCVESEAARRAREAAELKAKQDESNARITNIQSQIDGLKSGLKTSVWKNKEGNFNTSRLISDSVAGVVLGTAGGLITSNVIKKNQIKGGFEDIKCTISGQTVADYGDEFQVGMSTGGM